MPKVVTSSRRIRGLHHLQGPTTSSEQASSPPPSSVLWNAPRKVSFEDGHQSSSSFASSVVGAGSSSNSLASTASSCKSSLRRKAPSVCLVGLASLSSSSQHEASSTEALHCLSPTPSTDLDNNNSLHNSPTTTTTAQPHGQSTAPSSPWGHFVDILVPLDEEESPPPSPMDNNDNNSNKRSFFGFLHVPNHDDDESASTAPSFLPRQSPLAKRHKHRRCSSHPYGLQPRHHRRQRQRRLQQQPQQPSKPSFLPGFLLDESSPSPSEKTPTPQEVEQALRRLQV